MFVGSGERDFARGWAWLVRSVLPAHLPCPRLPERTLSLGPWLISKGGDFTEEKERPWSTLRDRTASNHLSTSFPSTIRIPASPGPANTKEAQPYKQIFRHTSTDSMFADSGDELLPGGY